MGANERTEISSRLHARRWRSGLRDSQRHAQQNVAIFAKLCCALPKTLSDAYRSDPHLPGVLTYQNKILGPPYTPPGTQVNI